MWLEVYSFFLLFINHGFFAALIKIKGEFLLIYGFEKNIFIAIYFFWKNIFYLNQIKSYFKLSHHKHLNMNNSVYIDFKDLLVIPEI